MYAWNYFITITNKENNRYLHLRNSLYYINHKFSNIRDLSNILNKFLHFTDEGTELYSG